VIKAVIFDLDGTVLDTLADLMGAVNGMLRHFGYPEHADPQFHKLAVGTGVRNYVRKSLPAEVAADEQKLDACVAKMREIYAAHTNDLTKPYPGICEMLDDLTQMGIIINVLSNKPNVPTNDLVSAWFSDKPFRYIFGEREGVPRKPDPQAPLEIAKELGFLPEEVAFVGDSGVDMQTGKNAGMLPIGVLWGFRSREELLENGAEKLAETPCDILEIVKNQ